MANYDIYFVAIILCGIGYWFLFKYLNKFFRLIRERYAIITAKITDYVQGIQMIQALNQGNKSFTRCGKGIIR